MHWTEPATSEDSHTELEKKLWDAANQLWAGADLKPSEYSPSSLVNHASGSAYPAVNAGIFEYSDIVVPPVNLLARFNAMAESNQVLQNKLNFLNKNLQRAREHLLPRLLSSCC